MQTLRYWYVEKALNYPCPQLALIGNERRMSCEFVCLAFWSPVTRQAEEHSPLYNTLLLYDFIIVASEFCATLLDCWTHPCRRSDIPRRRGRLSHTIIAIKTTLARSQFCGVNRTDRLNVRPSLLVRWWMCERSNQSSISYHIRYFSRWFFCVRNIWSATRLWNVSSSCAFVCVLKSKIVD